LSYALAILWHERNRYFPGVVAVSFSALLIVMQVGVLLGIFTEVGVPIEHTSADIWVGFPGVRTADITLTIPVKWADRLANQPEVEHVEGYVRGVGFSGHHGGGVELVTVLGTHLGARAVGPIQHLTPELRTLLAEPNAIVVDETEMKELGLRAVGDYTDINEHRVRLVGTIAWLKGMAGPYVFCSLTTARKLLGMTPDRVTYLLARCRDPADAPAVVQRLRSYGNMSAFTRDEFARQSRLNWLTKSKAGIALLFAALLGLLVGTGITSQTLYAATAALARQFAVLEAMGIPNWQMRGIVLTHAGSVGLLGIVLAGPGILASTWIVRATGGRVVLPGWVLVGGAALTMAMALFSGLLALRSLRLAEPTALLR
jgi:putative ABC transport system permease protein